MIDKTSDCGCDDLRRRIRELEEKVNHLRISRRVLMNLVEKTEMEKKKLYEETTVREFRLIEFPKDR
ncbi:hypothetical protein GGQ84_001854 [Desulfitispora alkaliphila]|uniref:hypothetical protein n=1 Tax=Desulfitispora alkaliphila TaxID=622674 RepID=UPI003D19C831